MTDDDSEPTTDDGSEPLGKLTKEVRERRAERDSEDLFETAFESVEIDEDDEAELWKRLTEDDEAATAVSEETSLVSVERDVHVIASRVCHNCQYFATPPEMSCTHEGTDILERVDDDQFCVADCPIVES